MFWCISYYLSAFGTVWFPYETRCKTGRTRAKVRATKSRQNFSQRTRPILPFKPKLTFWCISYHLGAVGTVWVPYETRWKTGRTSAFVPRSRVGIFCNERTRSTPLDTKLTFSCGFRSFRTIYVHSGPFGCLTKLGAKWTELVQKLVPRSRVGIFHNERTRSTLLDTN